jgi:hypothetical protein
MAHGVFGLRFVTWQSDTLGTCRSFLAALDPQAGKRCHRVVRQGREVSGSEFFQRGKEAED